MNTHKVSIMVVLIITTSSEYMALGIFKNCVLTAFTPPCPTSSPIVMTIKKTCPPLTDIDRKSTRLNSSHQPWRSSNAFNFTSYATDLRPTHIPPNLSYSYSYFVTSMFVHIFSPAGCLDYWCLIWIRCCWLKNYFQQPEQFLGRFYVVYQPFCNLVHWCFNVILSYSFLQLLLGSNYLDIDIYLKVIDEHNTVKSF